MAQNNDKNNQRSSEQMVQVILSEYSQHEGDSADLLQLILNLKKRWKGIFLITFIGAILSVAIAFYIPKVYQSSTQISLPNTSNIVRMNTNSINVYNSSALFKSYYEKISSENVLHKYLVEQGYLKKLYQEGYDENKVGQYVSGFAKGFNIEINDPVAQKGKPVENPNKITFSLQHTNEALLVELLNNYINKTNEDLIKEFTFYESEERNSKLKNIQNTINLLKINAKTTRELLISKLEVDNQQKLDILLQNKQLLINKAKEDRNTTILTIEESNQQKINELQQKRNLLIAKAAIDRKNLIVKAQEAKGIAESLNIILPTELDDLDNSPTTGGYGKTNISLSKDQTLPLYLMGTKYLATLMKTLNDRKSDAEFLPAISQINSDIELVNNDQKLKTLLERKSDAPFLAELNNINQSIEKITNDKKLKALKERKSDDPFIKELPGLLNQAEQLKSKTLDFTNIKLFTLNKSAKLTNKAIKPNRPLIAILGTFLAGFIALIWAVLVNSNRTLSLENFHG
jgi:LPS O-antigen subunit length determinant protein (WzzB/FepE family)